MLARALARARALSIRHQQASIIGRPAAGGTRGVRRPRRVGEGAASSCRAASLGAIPAIGFRSGYDLEQMMIQIKNLLSDPQRTLFEILQQIPPEQLDEAVAFLKQHRPASEVCAALMTFIATAPLTEFGALRDVYHRHCGDRA